VRLVTAMPITILTVGQSGGGNSNFAGFHLDNVSFIDTSKNGSVLGGLLIYDTSDAEIAYCDFENFNGQTADPANDGTHTFPNILAYGIKANPGAQGAFNNNIMLIHDKGKNNSVFYDSSPWGQDGPIVIGGDIFPVIPASTGSGFTGPCYGFITAGPVQMYGTHFDSGVNNTDSSACWCLKMYSAGLVRAKFESSATPHGNAVQIAGGSTASPTVATAAQSANHLYVTITVSGSSTNNFSVGQFVTVSGCTTDTTYNGTFLITSSTAGLGGSFTYDDAVTSPTSAGCGVAGLTTSAADVEAIVNNTPTGVSIQSLATNNKVTVVVPSTASVANPITDAGTNDITQVVTSTGNGNTYTYNGAATFNGSLTVPVAAGGFASATNGLIAYNSTSNAYHVAVSSTDVNLPTITPSAPTTGHCANWASTTTLGDAGGPCGLSAKAFSSGNSASIGSMGSPITLISSVPSSNAYRITYYLYQDGVATSCGTSPTVSLHFTWTDPFVTQTHASAGISLSNGPTATAGNYTSSILVVRGAASSSITYYTSFSAMGCASPGTYGVSIGVEPVQQ
jgi:hypothetical protein